MAGRKRAGARKSRPAGRAANGGANRIQDGVYFRSGQRPPLHWRLVLLDVAPQTKPAEARAAIGAVSKTIDALRRGEVRELKGQPGPQAEAARAMFDELEFLIGYGRRLFDGRRHKPTLTKAERPAYLSYLPSEGEAFPALPWVDEREPGEADVALQLTGASAAAVNRAAVEVWKLIAEEGLPLSMVGSYEGFGREDGRGWLEFHDGVGNMASSQRLAAIEAGADPEWMEGGTYMAFLRLAVDLKLWRGLSRAEQELVIGRDKLTGAGLVGVKRDRHGRARPVAGRALPAKPSGAQRARHADPPQSNHPLLEASHVHRANQNRGSPGIPAGLRMFRQGYEFMESIGPGGPELGLNFVSFQSDLGALQHVLRLPGWLGDVNFGGPASPGVGDPPSPRLIRLVAGGFYAVPPRGKTFPGAQLFT